MRKFWKRKSDRNTSSESDVVVTNAIVTFGKNGVRIEGEGLEPPGAQSIANQLQELFIGVPASVLQENPPALDDSQIALIIEENNIKSMDELGLFFQDEHVWSSFNNKSRIRFYLANKLKNTL